MSMVHVVLWKWKQAGFRETYTAEHVNIVARMCISNLPGMQVRVKCVTDDPEGIMYPVETFPLWKDHDGLVNATGTHLPSCYRRLKLFDRLTQYEMGIPAGDWIVSIDLDSIVLAPFNALFKRMEELNAIYGGWGVRGTYHQTVFNGSFWLFRAGDTLQPLWSKFDPAVSPKLALSKGFLGSDQAWLSMNLTSRNDVYPIRAPEFVSYPREVRRTHTLDRRTMIVFFHGSRKPWHPMEVRHQPWIARHWR